MRMQESFRIVAFKKLLFFVPYDTKYILLLLKIKSIFNLEK